MLRRSVWVVMLLAAGCGGGGGGGAAIPQALIGDDLHEAVCEWRVRCGLQPDVAACLASTRAPLGVQLMADLAAGKVIYDPQAGQAFVTWVKAMQCGFSSTISPATFDAEDALSSAAFKGTVQPGGACAEDQECLSGATCVSPAIQCAGTCVAHAPAARGQPCAGLDPTTECDSSSYCDTSAPSNFVCAALPTTPGRACAENAACGSGLVCVSPGPSSPETCEILPTAGQPCNPSMDHACDAPATYCEPTSKTCKPRLLVGAACDSTADACVAFATCDAASHTCVALGGPGAPCQGGAPTCLGDLSCSPVTSTCVADPLPAPCP
jgi:Dickkopf N-terminal cysteine-rich region